MKNKNAFTLIELLAVIVILAVVLIISIPIIGNVIEDAKVNSYKSSVRGLIDSAELYYEKSKLDSLGDTSVAYTFEEGVDISPTPLNFNGKVPTKGSIIISEDGLLMAAILYNDKCFIKDEDEDEIFYREDLSVETCKNTSILGIPQIFEYTGDVQPFTIREKGIYKFELWGAQGGAVKDYSNVAGGYGGFSTGTKYLSKGTVLNIHVGGKGADYATTGGWNGGGNGGAGAYGSGGGGGSDVRLNGTELKDRIIVAGGGGGSFIYEYYGMQGGAGGGLSGGNGNVQGWYFGSNPSVPGGTQTSGGTSPAKGTLGQGGNGLPGYKGGGGGGYYGGSGAEANGGAGAGGSSYIAGVDNGTTLSGQRTGEGRIIITLISKE